MTKRIVSGNEAVALAALAAGVKVITGYPGTPSSEAIGSIWKMGQLEGTAVEWSTNEKVALEVAGAAAWAGKRALCTMKMSGLNVAYDSLISIAYSGCKGGLVVYVCDDPGVSAGMCEQDTRGFALMSDMPMLEPASVAESYDLTKWAFELSEKIQSPVFVRSVTNVAQSHGVADIEERALPDAEKPVLERNIERYTKAGAVVCTTQHRELIERLEKSGRIIEEQGLNKLHLAAEKGGLGIISLGVTNGYIEEGLDLAGQSGGNTRRISTLKLSNMVPPPTTEIRALLDHCAVLLVVEELEPHLEKEVYVEAYRMGAKARIVGKLDGTLSRLGEYNAAHVAKGVCRALELEIPQNILDDGDAAALKAASRPITCCAGCPHRGTYLAINRAVKNAGYKKDDVIVTGDIGCTILGMNPPFHTVWMEISMGASIPSAQGFVYSGIDNPVIATIGDSTFFHAGIPGLINAVQHGINLTVAIMDNGWTAMTGMQVNPGTVTDFQQPACKQVDLVQVVQGLGVEQLFVVDPYNLEQTTKAFDRALSLQGVKVVVARRECAIQTGRRKIKYGKITVDAEKCHSCKLCINTTGCPALELSGDKIVIDEAQCNGCGLCAQICKQSALVKEEQ